MSIDLFIANSGRTLDKHLDTIKSVFKESKTICIDKLNAKNIDIIIVNAPYNTIKEFGIGGYTPSANLVYISLDPNHKIKSAELKATMLHEMHHAVRWQNPGYGNTLREALITEGLATLFEEEITGKLPIYAKQKLTAKSVELANKTADKKYYNHQEWFITGNSDIPKWFGYTYGYQITKKATQELNKSAAELVNIKISITLL